jgi:hypothetical protein
MQSLYPEAEIIKDIALWNQLQKKRIAILTGQASAGR